MDELRFEHFTQHTLPALRETPRPGWLVFVPSSRFCARRNALTAHEVSSRWRPSTPPPAARADALRGRAQARAAGHGARALLPPAQNTGRERGALLRPPGARRVFRRVCAVCQPPRKRVRLGRGRTRRREREPRDGGVFATGRAAAGACRGHGAREEDARAGSRLGVRVRSDHRFCTKKKENAPNSPLFHTPRDASLLSRGRNSVAGAFGSANPRARSGASARVPSDVRRGRTPRRTRARRADPRAPACASDWPASDDFLLREAVEAGAALGAIARGILPFSQPRTREESLRAGALLYDARVALPRRGAWRGTRWT